MAEVHGGHAVSLGGENTTATANNNTLVLTDVKAAGTFLAGQATNEASGTGTAQANGNTLILKGGTYLGGLTAGGAYSTSGVAEALNNRVELRTGASGAPDFCGTALIVGGSASIKNGDGTSTGNSLNFYDVKGMTAEQISGFQILNYEYTEMHAGEVILTLLGAGDDEKTTSIANADVNVSVVNLYGKDGGEFKKGDKVVLLKNDNGLVTEGITKKATIHC